MSIATKPTKAALSAASAPEVRKEPDWYGQYRQSYQSGEALGFLLTGDIEGFAFQDISQRNLLLANLADERDVVLVWHLASGGVILFDADRPIQGEDGSTFTRRQIAERILNGGKAPAAPAGGQGAVGAALAGLGPQQGGPADPFKAAQSPGQALGLLQTLLREGVKPRYVDGQSRTVGNVAVVIDYADALVPSPPQPGKGAMSPEDRRVLVTLLSWAKDGQIDATGNPIFLLARDREDIHPDIRSSDSGWKSIVIAPPDRPARLAYLEWYVAMRAARRKGTITMLDGLTAGEVANLTAGLSLRNLEDICLNAARGAGLSRPLLKAYKDAIVAAEYSEVAEMIDPLPGGFADLGGMQTLKDWSKRRIIDPLRAGLVDEAAKGVLLVGPPGVGKTYYVRALAKEIGFSGVALNADRILGGIVGESERNLAKFFRFARSLAPVLIFMDELDQSDMAQRGNNSGNPVAKNLFSAMLKFLSDETLRGQVIVVFASNRPDLMDTALIRSGRVDAIIPVLLPNQDERASIALAQAKGQKIDIGPAALTLLAGATEGWSSADIGAAVREAKIEAKTSGATVIGAEHIQIVLDDIVPSGLEAAKEYTLLAVQAVNRRRNLPPEYAALRVQPDALTAQIQAAKPATWGAGGRSERE